MGMGMGMGMGNMMGNMMSPQQMGYPPPGYPPPGYPPPGYPQYGYPPPGYPTGHPGYGRPPRLPLPPFPHPEPREYQQMLRTWTFSWWKPIVGILMLLVGMMVVAPLVLLPVLIIGVMVEGGPFWESFAEAGTFSDVGPAALLYLNLSLGALILVCWGIMRVLHQMRPRWLTSVVPKMRWRFFLVCLGLSVLALIAMMVVDALLPGTQSADLGGEVNAFTGTTVALAVIVLLTTPLQAAGEEYAFRGYLMQAVGSIFPPGNLWLSRSLALVVPAVLFALAHGVQNFPLFFDRFMFGLIAGWLVMRTGGLEAGIAMHILNNFLAFGFALLFSDLTETLNVSEVGWSNIPLTLAQSLTYAALVLFVARRMNLQRRTQPPEPPPTQPAPEPPEPAWARP
jgi:membrane protease YdiL (CAAX protease family)